jgi:hypothetical protein
MHSWPIRNPEKDLPYAVADNEIPAELRHMFRPLRKTDTALCDLVTEIVDFLGACLTNQIMKD